MNKQNQTNTILTNEQIQAAELLADPSYKGTRSAIIKKVGVCRTTFYDWFKNPDFVNYVNSLIDAYTDAELAVVWRALINKCKAGDTQAIKLYFELKGKYKQEVKQEIDVNTMGVILLPEIKEDSDVSADI